LWDLFQAFGPNAAGQVSRAQLQQQQREAGLVADVESVDVMMSLLKDVAAAAPTEGGNSSGWGGGSSSSQFEFEEFVALAQHVGRG
jgi:hypothetical protein